MIYEINNCLLEVVNEIPAYNELIFGRFSQFLTKNQEKANNFLKFFSDGLEICVKGQYFHIKGQVVKTDLYVIINNILSLLINDENNIYMHSVVVSGSQGGVLIVGDFGQGKTTLAREFQKNGYKINSTDQTWLYYEQNHIKLKRGSKFYMNNSDIFYIDDLDVMKNVEIRKIIKIAGICDNGKTDIILQDNYYHKLKQLAVYCNWSSITPLFSCDDSLFRVDKYTKLFLNNMKCIPMYIVRGNRKEIVKILMEIENI